MQSNEKNKLLKASINSNSTLEKLKINIPLQLILVIPFILQIFIAVGITAYLSFRNGQKAINNLANQLQESVSNRILLELDNYLDTAKNIAQTNVNAIKLGLIDLQNYKTSGEYFAKQIKTYEHIGFIDYTLPTGEY